MKRFFLALASVGAMALSFPFEAAASQPHEESGAQAIELTKQLISIRSVRGPDNHTFEAQELIRRTLLAAGWQAGDIDVERVDDTAYLIATWRGTDPKLKPLVVSGHLDVVEAKPSDWLRDPFTPVVENGFLYGRGALDMKFDAALATTSLIEMRKAGYRPKRTIVLQFSGDEETTGKTSDIIAERLKDADLVINIDAGSGVYDSQSGKALYWTWDGAEKTYGDFEFEVTNAGGHSSEPHADNAIVQMSTAMAKVGAYHFKPELNALTKGYWEKAAAFQTDAKVAAAMRAFAANPNDPEAIQILRSRPDLTGRVSTTCIPTMINGGHAQNALPQRVRVNINCRIFPGHTREEIRAELERVMDQKEVVFVDVPGDAWPASKDLLLRADFVAAAEKAMHLARPGVAVISDQASGGSDSLFYRTRGVPSYGAPPLFIKPSDDFMHGLNERVPLDNTLPSITYFVSLFTDLSR